MTSELEPDSDGHELNEKQKKFCREYIVDFNGTQAAIRAGYSENSESAKTHASKLLSKDNIQQYLSLLRSAQDKRLELKADRVLSELMRIAFADLGEAYDEMGNLLPIHLMPDDIRRALGGMEVFEEFEGRGVDKTYLGNTKKIKSWDKIKALELLGKHLKLFADKEDGGDGKLTKVFVINKLNGDQEILRTE